MNALDQLLAEGAAILAQERGKEDEMEAAYDALGVKASRWAREQLGFSEAEWNALDPTFERPDNEGEYWGMIALHAFGERLRVQIRGCELPELLHTEIPWAILTESGYEGLLREHIVRWIATARNFAAGCEEQEEEHTTMGLPVCPLCFAGRANGFEAATPCLKERCAWWSTDYNGCAVAAGVRTLMVVGNEHA